MFPLSHMLRSFVRIGTLEGDRCRRPDPRFLPARPARNVTMRLTDRSLYRKLFLNPELHAGEAYMDGRLSFEDSTLRDFLTLFSVNRLSLGILSAAEGAAAHLARPQALPAGEPGRQGAAERRPPLRPRQRLLQAVPRRGHAVLLRLFPRRRRHARGGAAQQAAPDRRQAAPEARPQGPRHRLRLGRPRALSGGAWRRSTSPASRCRRSSTRCRTRRRGAPGSATGCASSCSDYRARDRAASTASSRSACSSTSACTTTASSSPRSTR